jgi:hypothetical protein
MDGQEVCAGTRSVDARHLPFADKQLCESAQLLLGRGGLCWRSSWDARFRGIATGLW